MGENFYKQKYRSSWKMIRRNPKHKEGGDLLRLVSLWSNPDGTTKAQLRFFIRLWDSLIYYTDHKMSFWALATIVVGLVGDVLF